jgi:starch-binding outer membrane protein, SusD/RagB family
MKKDQLTIKVKVPVCIGFRFIIVLLMPLFILVSCKKLVESPPPANIVVETNAYSVDATAIAILDGIYVSMNSGGFTQPMQGSYSIALLAGLSADELTPYSAAGTTYMAYYKNALTVMPALGSEHWTPLYSYVFKCNAAIEGLTSQRSVGLTPVIKQQLLGEAKFMRAFFYFYLVNLFGDLPLCVTTDPEVNSLLARSPKATVYQQIIVDLQDAKDKLSADYFNGTLLGTTAERVRPTKWAASALLARVYLYSEEFASAEMEAATVINNTSLYGPLPAVALNDVFIKNSKEAIWQLQPTSINFNTTEAQTLVLPTSGPNSSNNPVYINNSLLNSFEPNDLRAKPKNWIDTITVAGTFYRFPYKYKINLPDATITAATGTTNMKEYFMVLRLGEQYLIRAEARAQQGNLNGAKEDLNAIRVRANLSTITTSDKAILLAAILHERQVELFTEWGHRWLDLKRTRTVDEIMKIVGPLKAGGVVWQSYQQLYPLPKLSDLDKAPNLEQNPEY